VRGSIWIDITEFFDQFRIASHPTGISRTVLNLADRLSSRIREPSSAARARCSGIRCAEDPSRPRARGSRRYEPCSRNCARRTRRRISRRPPISSTTRDTKSRSAAARVYSPRDHHRLASRSRRPAMASIIFADVTSDYDGRHIEARPLGGTETSVIRAACEIARRGHAVAVYTNCSEPIEHDGVSWRPLRGGLPTRCDLYVAVQQPKLLGLVRSPERLAIWVLWPSNQLRHYKKIWRMWRHRPIPVLESQYQVEQYSALLPRHGRHVLIPLGLADDVRGHATRAAVPAPRGIFASNPQRNLRRLVEIWATSILPRVPDAVLDVHGVNGLQPGDDAWKSWEGTVLPLGLPQHVKDTIHVHPTVTRPELIAAMRASRVMLYLGHKCEAFCLSLAEAQALGVPAVIADRRAPGARDRRRHRLSPFRSGSFCRGRGLPHDRRWPVARPARGGAAPTAGDHVVGIRRTFRARPAGRRRADVPAAEAAPRLTSRAKRRRTVKLLPPARMI
jgi:glycosyltransferase involved in cell wall biosynthesis